MKRNKKKRTNRAVPKKKTLHVLRSSFERRAREWKRGERRRGLLILQIDGLPHKILMRALSEGTMPFLKYLLDSGKFDVSRYRCGIPGCTPAAQSGIMYGENFGIPAFRWLDKKDDTLFSFKNPLSAQIVEERISREREGILTHGSSYVNLLSGGAERSVFTLSTFLTPDMHKRISGMAIFFLFFLNIVPVLRTIASLGIELTREFIEYLEIRLKGGIRKSEGFFPLVRIFSNVLFFEVATVGAIIDIQQGKPAIYLTYNGYDEAAHQRGPDTKYAFQALRVIDRGIRKVVKRALKKKRGRQYDIYILSDHGQHPSIPFRYQYGESLEDFIYSKVKEGQVTQYGTGGDVKDYLMTTLVSTLQSFAAQNLFFLRRLFRRIARYIERNISPERRGETFENISIVNSSPLSNLYFNFSRKRLDIEEIEQVYPGLIGALVRHDGIGLIAGRSNGAPLILSKGGRIFYGNGRRKSDGEDPLQGIDDPERVEQEILRQSAMPNAGDLVLYGAMKGSYVINFEEQMSGHGGVGGMQNFPFILYPHRIRFPFHAVKNTKELYPVFARYRNRHSSSP